MGWAGNLIAAVPRYAMLLRSQYWSPERLNAFVNSRLEQTLTAARAIPFYSCRHGGARQLADFATLPVLKRGDIAGLNESARKCAPAGRFSSGHSSGSTGPPAEFLFDRTHQGGRFAARARFLRAHGWSPFRRTAWMVEVVEENPDVEFVGSRLFPGARFQPILFRDYAAQVGWLRQLDPTFLCTLPSDLEGMLPVFEETGRKLDSLRQIFCGSEILNDEVRARAWRVLGTEIAEYYGSTEAFLAWQCPSGSLHVNSEHVFLEIVDEENRSVPSGSPGRVLVTTLENRLMPLVRYEIGDYAIASEKPCSCGRTLPRIERVMGRSVNLFRLDDGRLMSPWRLLDRIKGYPELGQFQLVQTDVETYCVRHTGGRPVSREIETKLRDDFRTLLAQPRALLSFERVAEIPRTRSGKCMTAICELDACHATQPLSARPLTDH
jgi:phenylacetate-CoA ligase